MTYYYSMKIWNILSGYEEGFELGHLLEAPHQMRKRYHVGPERIQLVCELVCIDLHLHVQLLHQDVKLLLVDDPIFISVHLFENQRKRLYLFTVLAQNMLEDELFELRRGNKAPR